ncbi:MAG TPA: porin [Gemmataceae bacterium]|nr:porin [Gemmataceae bacterium]
MRALPYALTIFLLSGIPARGQDKFASDRPIEDRVRELEEAVQRLGQAPPAAAPAIPFLAGWDEKTGFALRSADDRFLLRITGQIQADYRYYADEADTTDIPTFLVRRARLGIESTVLRYYEFRLLPDFGQGQARIQDAYLNVHYWDALQFEAGKFKQPFSYEQLIQDRFVPTLERSLIDQLVPARDVGLMGHGQNLLDGRLDYGASVYGGVINGDADTDRNKEVAGRIAARPLRDFGLPDWAAAIQLGIAGTYGEDRGVLGPTVLRTPAGVPWLQFAADVRPDGLRTRCSPELVYVYGPAALAAQYFAEDQELRRPPGPVVAVSYRGGYVLATCLLTGEERTSLSQPIAPLLAFDPVDGCFGPGAWELVARVSWLEVDADDRRGFAQLLDPARAATRATEVTTGFNWYWNRWVRMQLNWEHARFNKSVRLGTGPGGRRDHQNTLLARFQVIF